MSDELYDALAKVGELILAVPHTERHAIVDDYLGRQGLHPQNETARNFLVGVFLNAHERRIELKDAMANAWDEGFEAGATFRVYQVGPSGIPTDPPLNPYEEAR